MSEFKDQFKEKYRPDADIALDREIADALGDLSIDELLKHEQARSESTTPGMRKGKIIRVEKEDVFVDFGGKSQGVCPLLQFAEEPKVGDELEFRVDRFDKAEGLLILALKGAVASSVTWENLEAGQIVEGMVSGMNKGGLEVTVKGMRAFMPAGQVDVVFHKDISVFIGQKVTAEVTQFDRDKRNLIISRRNIIEREKEIAKKKLLEELAEGQVRRGTVRSVMDFGAFVDLGGVDGLVHVSEISHRRVKNPKDALKEGDVVDVKVIRIDREAGKLSLSLKQTMADPWNEAAGRYAVGTAVTARVAKIESFGAFLEVEEGIEGLLPISEISWQRINKVSDVLADGQTVKVVVINMDPVSRKMTFSLKQAGGDPWKTVNERYALDMVVPGKVTRTADFGAFIELEPGLEGLVHISELANQRVRTVGDVVKPGQEVRVRVLDIDTEKRRIGLSIRRAEEPVLDLASQPGAAAPAGPKKKRPQLRGGLEF
ncbi:MAG: S1 RNA-binding domain-containing protein [Tepidisphaerales bacterium]